MAGLVLDFPIEDRDVAVQCDVFPADLLAQMGQLGIDLMVSRCPMPSNGGDDAAQYVLAWFAQHG